MNLVLDSILLFTNLYSIVFICTTNSLRLLRRGADHIENTALILLRGADHIENTSTVAYAGTHRKHFYY
jgi:hypothetical protein